MNEEFKNIAPYSDVEAVEALTQRVAVSSAAEKISHFLFPEADIDFIKSKLLKVSSIEDFQISVMAPAVESVLAKTSKGFSVSGVDKLNPETGYVFISNHRDITLDPALVQYALLKAGLPLSDICVGDNLIDNPLIEDIMRSNRMIIVKRNVSLRELLSNSKVLSMYIRESVASGRSVWIAQSEGRAKDGNDKTAQGILKMLDMSGRGSFYDNFSSLNIVPLAISYEYEPCDILKAREKVLSKETKYIKQPGEDLNSILTGITQPKGKIHLSFCKPLTLNEIDKASSLNGNDRFQALCTILDTRINSCYKLWNTNYIAWDILNGSNRFDAEYTKEQRKFFEDYTNAQLSKVADELIDKEELRRKFLEIYANPLSKSNAH